MWKDSTHIGVGIASGRYGTFVVANYDPAGNMNVPGYFERNVLPRGASVEPSPHRSRKDSSSSSSSDEEERQPSGRKLVILENFVTEVTS